MLIFPDPSVSTEYTDPNGSVWQFNGTGWVRQPADNGGGIPPDADFDAGLDAVWTIDSPASWGEADLYQITARAWTPDLSSLIGETTFYAVPFGGYQELVGTTAPSPSNKDISSCADEEGNVYFMTWCRTSGFVKRFVHKITRYGKQSAIATEEGARSSNYDFNLTTDGSYLFVGNVRSNSNGSAPFLYRIPLTGAGDIDALGGWEKVDTSQLNGSVASSCGLGRMETTGQYFYGGNYVTNYNGGAIFEYDAQSNTANKNQVSAFSTYVDNSRAVFAPRRNRWWVAQKTPSKYLSCYEMRGGPPYTSSRYLPVTNHDYSGSSPLMSFLAGANGGLGSGVLVDSPANESVFIKDLSYTRRKLNDVCAGSSVGPSSFGGTAIDITESPFNNLTYLVSSGGVFAINCDTQKVIYWSDAPIQGPAGHSQYLIHTSSHAQKQAGFTPLTTREQEEHDAESDRMYAAYVEGEIARIESELQTATDEEKDQLSEQLRFFKKEQSE